MNHNRLDELAKAWRGVCILLAILGALATGYGVPSMLLIYGSGVDGCSKAFHVSMFGIGCFLAAVFSAYHWGQASIARTLEEKAKGGEK
jgi:hypothetical protein